MSGDGSRDGQGNGRKDSDDVELSARLKRLEQRLGETRNADPRRRGAAENGGPDPTGMGKAFRMSAEFMAGIIAGAGLGYVIDKVTGSSPWGLMILTVLGFCAGIYNVMRAAGFVRSARPPGGDASVDKRPGGGNAAGPE